MNRAEFFIVLDELSRVLADEQQVVVFGSQALHAWVLDLPDIALRSTEVDVAAINDLDDDKQSKINWVMGEDSELDHEYAVYAEGVSIDHRSNRMAATSEANPHRPRQREHPRSALSRAPTISASGSSSPIARRTRHSSRPWHGPASSRSSGRPSPHRYRCRADQARPGIRNRSQDSAAPTSRSDRRRDLDDS